MLEHFLIGEIFAFLLIFCRIGSCIMVLPGFSEAYVPPTIRLGLALLITLLLTPLLAPAMPPLPGSPVTLALLIGAEILTGLFIGGLCNILISATHIAGMIFSFQSGMSSAVVYDVTQSSQGSDIGNVLGILAIVLFFDLGLHHLVLRGLAESYSVFVPGKAPPLSDFVEVTARMVSDTFAMAVQISTPVIVTGTLLFLGGGVLARLMPTMQVFFVIIPPQLLLGFFILMTTFSAVMLWYMDFYRDRLESVMQHL